MLSFLYAVSGKEGFQVRINLSDGFFYLHFWYDQRNNMGFPLMFWSFFLRQDKAGQGRSPSLSLVVS